MRIILASKSPARAKLLTELGLKFEVMPAEIAEEKIREISPSATVKKIALEKAKKVLVGLDKNVMGIVDGGSGVGKELIIIAADTMVYLPAKSLRSTVYGIRQNSNYIGKPANKDEAKEILTALSGTTHWLYSGLCLIYCQPSHTGSVKGKTFLDFDKSRVTFRKLTEKEIDEYVQRENVHLWAGAYTIEKGTAGARFIKKIEGSKANVLGLPVEKLRRILRRINLISN